MQQALHRRGRHLDVRTLGIAIQEMMHQNRNVRPPLAQGREVHGHDIQPEIEVLAKGSSAISGFQVAIRRRYHAHIDVDLLVAAHRPHFFFL